MEHAPAVGVVDSVGQGGDEVGGAAGRDRAGMRLQPVSQSAPGAVLGRDVANGADLASLVDGNQVGMVEPGCCMRFAEEAPSHLRVGHEARPENLEGDRPGRVRVMGQVDQPKSAPPDLAQEMEPPQPRSAGPFSRPNPRVTLHNGETLTVASLGWRQGFGGLRPPLGRHHIVGEQQLEQQIVCGVVGRGTVHRLGSRSCSNR